MKNTNVCSLVPRIFDESKLSWIISVDPSVELTDAYFIHRYKGSNGDSYSIGLFTMDFDHIPKLREEAIKAWKSQLTFKTYGEY